MEIDTFPKLLKRNRERYGPEKVAMRSKKLGIWREYSWNDVYEATKDFCLGLLSLGLEAGDTVAIIGDNDPEWYYAELATQAAGGRITGVFVDTLPAEVEYVVDHSDAKLVLAKDQEQVDKILQLRDRLPKVQKVIFWDAKGIWSYADPWLMSFEEVQKLGRKYEEAHPGLFESCLERGDVSDIAIICYTSGTTGLPKGAILTFKNFLSNHLAFSTYYNFSDTDNLVSFYPLSIAPEQSISLVPHLLRGTILNFPEKPETARENVREIAPTCFSVAPRLWEEQVSQIQSRMLDSSALKRLFYGLCLRVGYRKCDFEEARKRPGLGWRVLIKLSDWIVFRPLRDELGLLNAKWSFYGGSALGPDCFRF
ncbi:AMP-binding protein, partial [Chloroflexota bacterium]